MSTHRIPTSRAGAAAVCAAIAALTTACAPSQKPCSPFNIGLAQLKDQGVVGTIPEVDQLMNNFLSNPADPVPGAAIGIIQNNQIVYLKGYGSADLGNLLVNGDEKPFTTGTMSRLGSISKTLTAIGVLQLAKDGYLNLDDPVSAHVAGTPAAWNAITIRELLSHQAGMQNDPTEIANAENFLNLNFPSASPHPGVHPRYAWYTYLATPVQFPNLTPGAARYSNTGYAMLGAVIDSVTTQAGFAGKAGYEEFLWWNVGLRGGKLAEPTMPSMCLDTYWRHDDIKDIAQGYEKNAMNQLVEDAYKQRTGWEGPPGGWDMTIGDLSRLAVAIQTNKLLDAASTLQMTSTQSWTIDRDLGQYGYGVFTGSVANKPVYSHGGNIEGYTARFTVWREQNFGIALLCNRTNASLTALEAQIANLYLTPPIGGAINAPAARMTQDDFRKMQTPEYAVATQHRDKIMRLVEDALNRTGTFDGAARVLRARLSTVDPEGRLIRALERGDYRTASSVYLQIYQQVPELR
jgi:CubicO group peptidase (beta-lactamase class C family)